MSFLVCFSPGSRPISTQHGYQARIAGFSLRVSADFMSLAFIYPFIYPTNIHFPVLGTGNLFGAWPELGGEVTRLKVLHWSLEATVLPLS